jgi:hypothetical protein
VLAWRGMAGFVNERTSPMTTKATALGPDVTNGAKQAIEFSAPYLAHVRIQGVADLLFHRWNVEAIDEKSKAAKGSKAKKTDNLESFVYRNDANELTLPGEYLRQSLIHAAKFKQDPRSPRKSAMDLFKAGVVTLTPYASLGVKDWDYEDRKRVMVQRNGVTRCRPAMKAGWQAEIDLQVALPEYIHADLLHDTLVNAGRLIGVGDFRPTYGRFQITKFEVVGAAL